MNTQMTRHLNTLILLASVALNVNAENPKHQPSNTINLVEQQLEIGVEIADNREEREHGLMNRTSLGDDKGMLFVYPDQAPRRVWMKNTLLPLDVLFLAGDGRIVAMLNNLKPCTSDPCPIFDSEVAAMFMLELNAGFIENNNLKIGQQLRLPSSKDRAQTD